MTIDPKDETLADPDEGISIAQAIGIPVLLAGEGGMSEAVIPRQRGVVGGFAEYSHIRKINSEPGDFAPDGTEGVVLSTLYEPEYGYFYFVRWDIPNSPRAIGILASKLELVP